MCFDNEAVLLSVAEAESAEQNVPTGSHLMRFGSLAGENLPFSQRVPGWRRLRFGPCAFRMGEGGGGGGALRK